MVESDLRVLVSELSARVAVLERFIHDPPADWDPRDARLRRIVRCVAGFFGVPEAAILGRGRTADLAWVRQVAMWACHEFVEASSVSIGAVFRRDHSTVGYALGCVTERAECEPRRRDELVRVRAAVERELEGV